MTWEPGTPAPTTPTDQPNHGTTPARGLDASPESRLTQGRFGRMFRNLPVFSLADPAETSAQMKALADRIVIPAEPDKPLDAEDDDQNPDIPAGYTYLGQFIDHDITFDPVSSLERQNDPDGLNDFRTPRFDLDSLYGRGPADQPYLYDPADRRKLVLGDPATQGSGSAGAVDLPRFQGRALIGDPRNDENLIVSQLQGVFLRLHNKFVELADQRGFNGDDSFKEAQRLTRWHYQWVVIHDFLREHIVGPEVLDDVLRTEPVFTTAALPDGSDDSSSFVPTEVSLPTAHLRFYHPAEDAYMPVEFSVAAYRYGHSMVRPSYFINDFLRVAQGLPRFAIFSENHQPDNLENLNGFRPLPDRWGFQWKYFFEVGSEDHLPQPSYRIDDELTNPLGTLPDQVEPFRSLAFRNLMRGVQMSLPSGQAVARAMGIEPLTAAELDLGDVALAFVDHAPLWYYVLREAKIKSGGRRLGPVGGRIVAETLVGLLDADPLSYLSVEPNWKPDPELSQPDGTFGMPELLSFVGVA